MFLFRKRNSLGRDYKYTSLAKKQCGSQASLSIDGSSAQHPQGITMVPHLTPALSRDVAYRFQVSKKTSSKTNTSKYGGDGIKLAKTFSSISDSEESQDIHGKTTESHSHSLAISSPNRAGQKFNSTQDNMVSQVVDKYQRDFGHAQPHVNSSRASSTITSKNLMSVAEEINEDYLTHLASKDYMAQCMSTPPSTEVSSQSGAGFAMVSSNQVQFTTKQVKVL